MTGIKTVLLRGCVAATLVLAAGCGGGMNAQDPTLKSSSQSLMWFGEEFTPPTAVANAVSYANSHGVWYSTIQVRGFEYGLSNYNIPSHVPDALTAVQGLQEYGYYNWTSQGTLTAAQFNTAMGTRFGAVMPSVNAWLSTTTETKQYGYMATEYLGAPGSTTWFKVYVVIYPLSGQIAVIERQDIET